uniref:Uncharacterized protein n=1 Tax=Arundo donax TaxID=35708 RepID=A0A0A8YQ48_ARUDO
MEHVYLSFYSPTVYSYVMSVGEEERNTDLFIMLT